MTDTALVNDVVLWLVIVMALLLVMFVYAVIVTPAPGDAAAEPPELEPPALEPYAPAAGLPARRPLAPMSPAGAASLSGDAVYPARHTRAAAPVIWPPKVPRRPHGGRVSASILAIAGLVITAAGARMFLGTGDAVNACPHHAVAVCLDGFVLLDAAQLLGGAMALAGLGFIVTAIVVALR